MKITLLTLIFFTFNTIHSQNQSYCSINSEVYSLLESNNYPDAKVAWKKIEKQFKIDPGSTSYFLEESLKYDDLKYFKRKMTSLIKNHGYHFFATDTLVQNLGGYSKQVYDKGLHLWLIKKTNKLYPKWIKKNPNSYLIQQKMKQLFHDDQIFRSSISFKMVTDTNCTGKELNWDVLERNDYQNVADIAMLAINNGILPNHFDNGLETFSKMQLIIWHNLKTEKNYENTWMILSHHIDKAYFEGKIDARLYASYDQWLFHFTGYQYYGFQGDAPVENQAEFEKRKEKYKFCY